MSKFFCWVVVLCLASCATHVAALDGKRIIVKSFIPERVKILVNNTVKLQEVKYGTASFKVMFADDNLKTSNFEVSMSYNKSLLKGDNNAEVYTVFEKIDSLKQEGCTAVVYKLSSDKPYFQNYGETFKLVTVTKVENGITCQLANYSTFEDKVSMRFLLEKLHQIEVKPKQ